MSVTAERVGDLIVPILAELGLSLYDLEYTGSTVRVLVDRPGGVDLAAVTEATRRVSASLDEADVISSAYTLEVSSPGLERNLRTPAHFAGAIGDLVKIKTRPNADGERRADGRLVASDETSITVELDDGTERRVQLADIDRARTHFLGDAAPKPGKGSRPGTKSKSKQADAAAPTSAEKAAAKRAARAADAEAGSDPRTATDSGGTAAKDPDLP